MKKTKIICTLGPATTQVEDIKKLITAGMNVARINMSHGSYEEHKIRIDNAKAARKKLNVPIAIMADTKGPEIRIKTFEKGEVVLKDKQDFTLTSRDVIGNNGIVSLAFKKLPKLVFPGDKIFANNGMLVLKVKSVTETDILCRVVNGGKLTDRKGINVSKIKPDGPYLSEQDKSDIKFAIENDVEYIAASFVCTKEDVKMLRDFLKENGAEDTKIISKIENLEGVANTEEIVMASDGVMVARGDLGVEVPLEKLPEIQKKIIKICKKYGKIAIVATEMLESMTNSIRPTRAEVSDVANAIYDLAGSTMLSGETAIGAHPALVTRTLSKILKESENNISYNKRYYNLNSKILSVQDAVADSTCKNAISLGAKLIAVYTNTGTTAALVSRHRINVPIVAFTQSEKIYNALALYWNVIPVKHSVITTEQLMLETAESKVKELGLVKRNDIMIVTIGTPNISGSTNMMRVIEC